MGIWIASLHYIWHGLTDSIPWPSHRRSSGKPQVTTLAKRWEIDGVTCYSGNLPFAGHPQVKSQLPNSFSSVTLIILSFLKMASRKDKPLLLSAMLGSKDELIVMWLFLQWLILIYSRYRSWRCRWKCEGILLFCVTLRGGHQGCEIEEIQTSVVGGQIRMERKQSNVSLAVIML